MASKLSLALVFVCFLQVCLSARISRGTQRLNGSFIHTMEDLNRVERRLAERMPPQNAERFENVMHKLEKVATYVENLDRVMQLIAKDFEDNVYKSDWEWQEILKNMDNEWDQ